MKVNIGIIAKPAGKIVGMLNRLLADEYILFTKTRNCHWNMYRPAFMEMHKFYEVQYEQLRGIVEQLSERATQLGSLSTPSLREFLEWTRLKNVQNVFEPATQVQQLLNDHDTLSRQIRQDIGQIKHKINADDVVTLNLLGSFLKVHENMAQALNTFLHHNTAVAV